MTGLRRLLSRLAAAGYSLLSVPALVVVALRERLRPRRARPRVLFGTTPIINIKYWSQALRAAGYESTTLVREHYAINQRGDFDHYYDDFLRNRVLAPARPTAALAWALRNCDVLVTFFDGGLTADTLLEPLEPLLLRLAGKRLVVTPYGSDIAVPGTLGPFEEAFARDYPETATRAPLVRRRVDRACRHASAVIANLQNGYLPRRDAVWPHQLAIDTERWFEGLPSAGGDGHCGEVVVVHAPNHRSIKATPAVLDAVDQLRAEGLSVRLELLEGRPNEEVRAIVTSCDLVAEQFIGGYAMFAIEAMSAGRPTLSNLTWMPDELRSTPPMRACPIVNATPETLTERLRELVRDPQRRVALGRASRDYALRFHSAEAAAVGWGEVLAHVWDGAALPQVIAASGAG